VSGCHLVLVIWRIGRPYLEVACLAELAFASKIEPSPDFDEADRWLRRAAGA
jgi:hypothetical protein